jgi:hypothetical protein
MLGASETPTGTIKQKGYWPSGELASARPSAAGFVSRIGRRRRLRCQLGCLRGVMPERRQLRHGRRPRTVSQRLDPGAAGLSGGGPAPLAALVAGVVDVERASRMQKQFGR